MSCERAICAEHLRADLAPDGAERLRCVECLRSSSSRRRRDDDDFLSSDRSRGVVIGAASSSGSSDDAAWSDQSGGAFGGGGATGGWDAAEGGGVAGKDAPDAFSAEDLAAFDTIAEADKDRGSPGYDS